VPLQAPLNTPQSKEMDPILSHLNPQFISLRCL